MLKRLPSWRWLLAFAFIVLGGASVGWFRGRNTGPVDDALTSRVKRGDFKVVVTTSGELRAPKFVQVMVPRDAQRAGAYQLKIQSIVPEGSIVKEGDVVAELDRSLMAPQIADLSLNMQKARAQNEQASLDSTLNLSKAREDLRNAALTLEEKKLVRDQSKFEAPSVRRQVEIDYDRALRQLAQDSVDLKTKIEQAKAKMREVGTDLQRMETRMKLMQEVMGQFTIKAPAGGMVIYVKEWNGKKRGVGSQVNPWEGTVATLPDFSAMESHTYVNELDVRQLAVGQAVTVSLDADATRKLAGKVTSVANVGEQRPNSDAKVFEVKITLEKSDTTLRPGMTTGNAIETYTMRNALFVPLEAVMGEQGVPYVFLRSGNRTVRQEVETGALNDDAVIIVRGVNEDDRLLLSPPVDGDKLELARLPVRTTPSAIGGDTAVRGRTNATVKTNPAARTKQPVPPRQQDRGR